MAFIRGGSLFSKSSAAFGGTQVNLRSALINLVPPKVRLHKRALKAWHSGERELRLLSMLCRPDANAIDVGANCGIFAFYLRKYSARVFAIEPNSEWASFIRSALPDVCVIEAAASDHMGEALLRIPVEAGTEGMATVEPANPLHRVASRSLAVPMMTLDSLNLSNVGFIKIDVEGHELAALQGAVSTIERDHPNLLIEAEERHRPNAVRSVADFLLVRGYKGLFLTEGSVIPIERFDPSVHQNVANLRGGAHPLYVNNFVFVHRADEVERLLAFNKNAGARTN
ncbi:MAG: FkbM family methyltransferase [Alphaproteobacteria bacterium]